MRWIRWPGLIAFVVVVGIVFGIWFLVIDGLVKRGIEAAGGKLVGAKVELDSADVSFLPLGIELRRLQVTNPNQPMRNAVEFTRIAFGMEALQLLRRKVIIDEMVVDGMQFNTPRQTSGAIARREEPKEEPKEEDDSFFAMPALDLPSAKDVLAKEDLESLRLVESVRSEIDAERERWKQRVAGLADQAKLDEYRRRADEIRKSAKGAEGVLGNVAEAAQLRKDVMADLDQVKAARQDLSKDIEALKRRVDEVAAAPQADLKRLKEKYALSAGGMANVANALFGGSIGYWAKTSAAWYERLQPMLAASAGKSGGPEVVKPLRGKGVDVKFPERRPLPDFLISTARVTAEIPAGTLKGEVLRITPDQDILGAPTIFEFSGDKLQQLRSVALRGEINRVKPDRPRDIVTLAATGYHIQRAVLSDNPKWPVVLDGAEADVNVNVVVASGALDANIDSRLSAVRFSSGERKPEGRVAEAIASALADVKAVQVGATVTGTTSDPDMKVTSDLDAVLKNAVGKMVSEQAARLEGDLKTAIAEKVNGPLEDLKKQLAGYGELGQALASRSDALNALLTEKLSPKIKGLKLPF